MNHVASLVAGPELAKVTCAEVSWHRVLVNDRRESGQFDFLHATGILKPLSDYEESIAGRFLEVFSNFAEKRSSALVIGLSKDTIKVLPDADYITSWDH